MSDESASKQDCYEAKSPIDRLFVEDQENRPDEIVIDAVTTMDTAEFVDRLEALADAAEVIDDIAADLERLRETGLTDADARDLIYGRNASIRKGDIEDLFDAMDDIIAGRADDPLVRLLADLSGLTLSETRELFDELDSLQTQYGGDHDK